MFKKEKRLASFVRLSNPSVFHTPFFTVKIAENGSVQNKFGFIVTKKIDKRATFRNRIKRKVRAILENEDKNLKQGFNFLFFVKKEAMDVTSDKITNVLNDILKKRNLFK